MTKYRKSRSLTDALETIQRLRTEDQAKILRKAVNQSNIQDKETLLMSNSSPKRERQLLLLLWSICGNSLTNDDFVQWLAGKLEEERSFAACNPKLVVGNN